MSDLSSHVALLESDPTGHDRRLPIATVDVSQIGGSPAKFYEIAGGKPIIIRGVFDKDPFLSSITMDTMKASFKGRMLDGFNTKERKFASFRAEDVFEDILRSPKDRSISIVDHPIEPDNEFGAKFIVPSFFDDNWLSEHKAHEGYIKSIFFSGRDNFTAYHVDSWGMQGWMYLAQGRKWWELTPVSEQVFVFDPIMKEFYDYGKAAKLRQSDAEAYKRYEARFPHRRLATRFVGELKQGEVLWFPPGWVHQVWTYEPGFGVGGAVHNHYVLPDTIYSHLFNRSFSNEDPIVNVRDMLAAVKTKAEGKLKEESGAEAEKAYWNTVLKAIDEGLTAIDAWTAEFEPAEKDAGEPKPKYGAGDGAGEEAGEPESAGAADGSAPMMRSSKAAKMTKA